MLFGERKKAEDLYGADRAEYEVKETLAGRWGWYLVIHNLAADDILKVDKIVKRPANEVFNFLSLSAEVNKERERMDKYRGN